MSDIRKWIQLLSEDSIMKGSAVKLSDDFGGGVGTFQQLAEDNPDIAIVNVKGNTQEIPLTSLQKVLDQDSEYGEDPCYNITPDLFEPGASVRVKNLYGGGTGDGYGVFIAYSTDGNTAIVNVDSEERSIPVDLVYPSDEQQAKDDFSSSGSDGSQSPFTSAGDNVQDKGTSSMSDMERWMDAVNNPKTESAPQPEEQVSEDCGCGDYECTTCFPLSEDEINGAMQSTEVNEYESEDEEELVELDLDGSDYYDDDDMEMPEPDAPMDVAPGVANDEMSMDEPGASGASEDVSDILGKIEYIQNMGMSMTDRHYDVDQLMRMRPDAIKRIYSKILGEGTDDQIDEGDLFPNSDDTESQSLMLDPNEQNSRYTMISPGDHIIYRGHNLVYKGFDTNDGDYALVDFNGKTSKIKIANLVSSAVPADLVETSAGGVAVAAGLGKVFDKKGIYEAASIDPADVKSLERMGTEDAKAKAAEMVQNSRTSDQRKAKLISNIGKSRNTMQVLQLMYNLLLAGDGMSTIGSKWQGKYNEAVDPHDDFTMDMFGDEPELQKQQSDPELDRMRELAGMGEDDGMQSGYVNPEDFKEMFWDYWDKSSSSSQHQYLTTVFGEDARIEDFSDAAAQAIKYITTNPDTAKVDKQLHLLRRIGMPLYSVCTDTGQFCPA